MREDGRCYLFLFFSLLAFILEFLFPFEFMFLLKIHPNQSGYTLSLYYI